MRTVGFSDIPHLWWKLGKDGFLRPGTLLYVPSYIESAIMKMAPYWEVPPIGSIDVANFPVGIVSPRVLRKGKFSLAPQVRELTVGTVMRPEELEAILIRAGFRKVPYVKGKFQYAVRGEVVDFYFGVPVRIVFEDDQVIAMRSFSTEDQVPTGPIQRVVLPVQIRTVRLSRRNLLAAGYRKFVAVMPRVLEYEVGEELGQVEFDVIFQQEAFQAEEDWIQPVKVITAFPDKVLSRLVERGISDAEVVNLLTFDDSNQIVSGFFDDSHYGVDFTLLTDYDLFPWVVGSRRRDSVPIEVGTYVIHRLYGGIGIVEGIEEEPIPRIVVRYKGDVKIKTPLSMLSMLHPYITTRPKVELTEPERRGWSRKRKNFEEKLRQAVEELVAAEAARRAATSPVMEGDKEVEEVVAAGFPYVLTPDQKKAISEIYADLASGKPMDRLVCGDTGFGKTEVAIRATARVVGSGYRVLIVAPTSVLARQLFMEFDRRFSPAGVNVGLYVKGEGLDNLKAFRDGRIDILVGTHGLFREDLIDDKLGMVVIDDEHLFGVQDKEFFRIRAPHVHHLMMSATPIPRTLFHALSGLRKISLLSTPPPGRLPVEVVVAPRAKDEVVLEAVREEIERGRRVIFVHNRISGLAKYAGLISRAVKGIRVEVLHGRLPPAKTQEVLDAAMSGEVDVLVSTAIVGVGLNLLNFSSVIVSDIRYLGLAALYQIKGRVGRTAERGRVYFFYSDTPRTRDQTFLDLLSEFGTLGYGFVVANLDMEIRGVGQLFGFEQTGFFDVDTFGYDLARHMLSDTIAKVLGKSTGRVLVRWHFVPFDFLSPQDKIVLMGILAKGDWDAWQRFRMFVSSTYRRELADGWDDYFALLDILSDIDEKSVVDIWPDKLKVSGKKLAFSVELSPPGSFSAAMERLG